MHAILTSFLAGAAFVSGASIILLLIHYLARAKEAGSRSQPVPESLKEYWERSLVLHVRQVAALETICEILEKRNK